MAKGSTSVEPLVLAQDVAKGCFKFMSQSSRSKQHNRYVRNVRIWRTKRTRPQAKGSDRALAWKKKPLSIWPSQTSYSYCGVVELYIPQRFSMIENPEETIAFLQKLRNVVGSPQISGIQFHHQNCEHTDLCASILMDVILLTAQTHWKWTKQQVVIRGNLPPPGSPVHKLLVNSGVVAHLLNPKDLPQVLSQGVHKFKLVKGGLTAPLDSARKEIVATGLATYFANCMRTEGFELKLAAQGLLTSIVSEVLDNAELHGNADGRWYAIGYFNRDAQDIVQSFCHIVLFNFGDSVYQSLKRKDGSTVLKDKLKELSRRHEKSLLTPFSKLKESTLWSLYALQEGVSRLSHKSDEIARGGGTVDMISFFNELSAGEQRMSIISGDAYILNDGTFKPRKDRNNNTVLAFNEDNDLNKAPDLRFVRALSECFPGTLISLRFPFNRKHLEGLTLQVDASDDLGASDGQNRFRGLVIHVNNKLEKT